jgi:hypothetical protein
MASEEQDTYLIEIGENDNIPGTRIRMGCQNMVTAPTRVNRETRLVLDLLYT